MIVKLVEDENGELILPLGEDFCQELGWEVGDSIDWIENDDGTWSLVKQNSVNENTELVLVETISTFRIRYIVEVPIGKKEYALDTVTCDEANELSQEHIGEQIVSHRVVTRAEVTALAREDMDWATEVMIDKSITRWTDAF